MNLTFDWIDKIKRYSKFSGKELRGGLITILVLAFMVSFNDWGPGNQVDIGIGLTSFLGALLIVAISFFIRQWIQKIVALGADFQAEYKLWSFGLLGTLLIAALTKGKFWFIIPGGIIIHYLVGHRLGWVRYGLNYFGVGVVSMAGPLANIVLAMIFRTLFDFTGIAFFHTAFIFNIIWALWTSIPIPPTDGSRMFFGSRLVYMYTLAVVVSSAILLYANFNIFLTILASLALAWIWWLIYYLAWERYNWMGPY
ncbi:hypothetical protein GOV09_00795 [Candidatus Woesearchaeota archaeon]|nr:hypothetical protein [Candidatus Woesearchaeota archaeon]